MLPMNAPSVDIDVSANTVTLSGTLDWGLIGTSSGSSDVFAARTSTPYRFDIPFRGGIFDPEFSAPTAFAPPRTGPILPGQPGVVELPGTARASVGDLKKTHENDVGTDMRVWAFSGQIDESVDPQGIFLDHDGIIDVNFLNRSDEAPYYNGFVVTETELGPLDGSQYYFPILTMNADFTAITSLNVVGFGEFPFFNQVAGISGFVWEAYVGADAFEGEARIADYLRENGIDPGAPEEPIPPGRPEPTEGNDRIDLGDATDGIEIDGLAGNDALTTGSGGDTIWGGAGRDTLVAGDGDDRVNGEAGRDILRGGAGADAMTGGGGADRLFGQAGADTMLGGGGRDRLMGAAGNDSLVGNSGNDVLNGGGGRDRLEGGRGDDTMLGGAASDGLFGGRGRDSLVGGQGQDTLLGGTGQDTLTGGVGADVFVFGGTWGVDRITDFDGARDELEIGGAAEASSRATFQAALRQEDGQVIYDAGRDGQNVIVFEGLTLDQVRNGDVEFL